jgi:hypothetical protein
MTNKDLSDAAPNLWHKSTYSPLLGFLRSGLAKLAEPRDLNEIQEMSHDSSVRGNKTANTFVCEDLQRILQAALLLFQTLQLFQLFGSFCACNTSCI